MESNHNKTQENSNKFVSDSNQEQTQKNSNKFVSDFNQEQPQNTQEDSNKSDFNQSTTAKTKKIPTNMTTTIDRNIKKLMLRIC